MIPRWTVQYCTQKTDEGLEYWDPIQLDLEWNQELEIEIKFHDAHIL